MTEDGNLISLNARLTSILFEIVDNVDDPAVVRYIRGHELHEIGHHLAHILRGKVANSLSRRIHGTSGSGACEENYPS